jgi:hypothetical protein
MAKGIVYLGYTAHVGGDATVRFNIRGQEYEYHMSKYNADKVNWMKKFGSGRQLAFAKKNSYSYKRAAAKYDHINFRPPEGARKAAQKALKWKEEHGSAVKGGTAVGWTRARQLADGGEMSVETVKRMYKFFQRHEKNKAVNPEFKGEPWRDNGYVAWLIWGGDAGKSWAEKLWRQMEAADAKTASSGWVIRFWVPKEVLHKSWLERKEKFEHRGRSIAWNPKNWDEPTDGEFRYWAKGMWSTNPKSAFVFDTIGKARGAAKRHKQRGVAKMLEVIGIRNGRPERTGEKIAAELTRLAKELLQ